MTTISTVSKPSTSTQIKHYALAAKVLSKVIAQTTFQQVRFLCDSRMPLMLRVCPPLCPVTPEILETMASISDEYCVTADVFEGMLKAAQHVMAAHGFDLLEALKSDEFPAQLRKIMALYPEHQRRAYLRAAELLRAHSKSGFFASFHAMRQAGAETALDMAVREGMVTKDVAEKTRAELTPAF